VRGRIGSTAYRGEIIEINQARFVRRYYATGQGIDAADFVRTVCFDFAAAGPGTGWNCSVHTNVRGVRDSVLKVGVREQRTSMRRSLDRLRVLAGGGQAGLLTRVNDGNSYGQAL
jgi:hypothetical protein